MDYLVACVSDGVLRDLCDSNDSAMVLQMTTFSTTSSVFSLVSHDPKTSPYAAVVASSGPMAKSNPFRFSTKWWDDETGLGLWGYRWYGESRWLSRDPMEEWGGINVYSFVINSSVNRIDKLGLMASPPRGSAKCGCCCIEDLTLVDDGLKFDNTYTIPYSRLATHNFHVDVSMSYGPDDKDMKCKFMMNESWEVTGDTWGPSTGSGIRSYDISPTSHSYTDAPGLYLRRTDVSPWILRDAKKTLKVTIKVSSESGCACSYSSKTIKIKMKMDASSGGVNNSSVTEM